MGQLEASPVAAVTENIAPDSNIAATKEIPQEAAKEIPSMQKESLQPKVAKPKTKHEAKSVLSQATGLKSAAAMSLSQMTEAPNRAAPKAPRGDVAADRKSALSTSIPMTSSAALALGGLGKVNAKKHSGSNERSSTESVVPGANPPAAMPRGNSASNSVSDNPK